MSDNAQRVVAGRDFTASVDFGVEEDELPVGLVSFLLVDSAGAVVVGPTAATGAGSVFTFDVPAAAVPRVDLLTASWTSSVGIWTTAVDVRASRVFTVPALLAVFPELAGKSLPAVERARMAAEDFLEDQCGRAFTRAFAVESFPAQSGLWHSSVLLDRYPVLALRFVTVGGVALGAAELAGVAVDQWGVASGSTFAGATVVGYEHGGPVADVDRVAMILARHRLLKGPLDDRAIGMPVEGGGVISLLTPGVRGSVTGLPEVDVFLQRHRARVVA